MAIDRIIQELEIRTSAADKNLDDVIKRLNVLEKEFKDVEKNSKKGFEGAQKPVNDLSNTVKQLGKTIAATFALHQLVSFGREAVKAAAAFENSMRNVATLVDTNVESMDEMSASVRELAKQTPVELEQLSAALYDVRSAGISAEDAMAVLEASAQLGVAGLSTTAEAANIMTSAINAFAAEGLSAEQVSDILFKTVKAGKTTLAELTNQFGGLAPAAAAAGISLADLQAATAAITTLGTPASVAQTQLKQAITELQKPGAELSKIFQRLGAKDGLDLIETSGGLGNAFKLIKEEAEASGMTVSQVTGSVETASAILALGGTVNESYTATLADMRTGANAVNGAFEKQAQTADAQFQLMQNAFEDVKITIGNALMPALLGAAEGLRDFLDGVDADTIKNLGKLLFVVASGFGAIKAAAFVKDMGGVKQVLKGVTGGVKGLSKAVMANPFGLLATAAAALIAYMPDIIDAFDGVSETQKAIKEAGDKATESLIKEKVELNELATALKTTNPESKERAELLDEFNKLAGTNLQNLEDETANYYQLQAAVNAANNEFDRRITLAAKEAMAQKAKELQLEAQVKQEKIFLQLQKQGISREEALRKVQEKREQTGKNLLRIGLGLTGNTAAFYDANDDLIFKLAELQGQEKEATDELELLRSSFTESTSDASKLAESIGDGQGQDGGGGGGKKTLVGAFEALNKEASDLKANLMEAIAQGNMTDARAYAASLGEVEGKLRNISSIAKGLTGELDFDAIGEDLISPEINFDLLAEQFGIAKIEIQEIGNAYDEAMAKQDEFFEKGLKQGQEYFEFIKNQPSQFEQIQGAVGGVQNAFQGLNDYLISAGLQNSQFQQSVAIFQITLQQAMAIAGAIRAATQGAKDPFTLIASIGTVVGAVLSTFAQVNSVLNSAQQPQRPTGFFEGTDYLTRNGAPSGKDTIPAMLNEGEAVIPTADNAKYPGLAKSWINGDLDNYIYRNWVAPALSEAEAKKNESMADNLAKSIAMNMKGGFDDYRLYRTNRQGNSLLAQIADNTRPRMNKKRRYN